MRAGRAVVVWGLLGITPWWTVMGCGGGSSAPGLPALGGTVTGLAAGGQLLLLSGAGTQVTIKSNGNFEFPDRLKPGTAYTVTVNRQPSGQTCTVEAGSGTMPASGADARGLPVICSANPHSLGGTVTGLRSGGTLALSDGGVDGGTVSIAANGAFMFPIRFASGGKYAVKVDTQPVGQECRVASASGSFSSASINTVAVTCTDLAPTISGTVSGLAPGQQAVLLNNASDPITITANGPFQFPAPLTFGAAYRVTVSVQPTAQICSVADGVGVVAASNVVGVQVNCAARTYGVGGAVVGLSGVGLSLANNGQEVLRVNASGSFSFPTTLPSGASYSVTVAAQPVGQICTVTGGSGRVDALDVRSISVQCVAGSWRSRLLAGSGAGRTTDGIGSAAEFAAPAGSVLLPSGMLVVTEVAGSVLRRVNPSNGQVVTYSGAPLPGYADSAQTRSAAYRAPRGMAIDRDGNVYVADTGNHVIRRIDAFSGAVSTWAGTGQSGFQDGPAASVRFASPEGVAVDAAGNVYVADTGNHVIRRIAADRTVTTVAGAAGVAGFANGAPSSARFRAPAGIAVDASGQLYVSDSQNGAIRMINLSGQVLTLAGNGVPGDADGTGSGARLSSPTAIVVDSSYMLYVADSGNHKIRTVQVLTDQTGLVQTLAGTGLPGDRDGENLSIELRQPMGLSLTSSGDLLVSEAGGHRIRTLFRAVVR